MTTINADWKNTTVAKGKTYLEMTPGLFKSGDTVAMTRTFRKGTLRIDREFLVTGSGQQFELNDGQMVCRYYGSLTETETKLS